MYLIDTNIFLHVLLKREKYLECLEFLRKAGNLHLTKFTLYSISIFLCKLKEYEVLDNFTKDLSTANGVRIIDISSEEIKKVVETSKKYNLDFDDALQYFVAKREKLVIISYDKDFDKTPKKRKVPEQVLCDCQK